MILYTVSCINNDNSYAINFSFASKKLYFKFASCNSSSTFLVQQIVVINTSWVMREAPEGSSMEKLAKGSVPIH